MQLKVTTYSIIETAKENGPDPYRYLLWIFREAPKAKAKDDSLFKGFLPAWAPENSGALRRAGDNTLEKRRAIGYNT